MSDFVPKFLEAPIPEGGAIELSESDPSAVPASEEQIFSYRTRLPVEGRPLTFFQKELARLLSLGKRPSDIAEQLKCSLGFVNNCMKSQAIIEEAERYRDRIFEGDVAERLKELNADAFSVAEGLIRDPNAKINLKWDAAKWILEKTTGKAIQAVDIQSSTLEAFHKLLTDMSQRGEALDVTPVPSQVGVVGELGPEVPRGTSDAEELGFDAESWVRENA